MPNNRNTDIENPPLDAEDWEIAFEPYEGQPGAALSLGFQLMILRSYLSVKPLRIQDAIEGIDCALDVLFPFTEFHEVSQGLFLRLVEGKQPRDEEKILEALGNRILIGPLSKNHRPRFAV
jgi:hypothetical protein